jgi:hypothetical protein
LHFFYYFHSDLAVSKKVRKFLINTFRKFQLNESFCLVNEYNFDFCSNNKCKNNSTCEPLKPEDLVNFEQLACRFYSCICKRGFAGTYCEQDVRPCSKYFCVNNSSCIYDWENPMKFECRCRTGFSGRFCEFNKFCHNITCKSNGVCVGTPDGYKCLCDTYFSGDLCETKSAELEVLEKVSTSVSVVGIVSISTWFMIVILSDLTRFVCRFEPHTLHKQRQATRRKKMLKALRKTIEKLTEKYNKMMKKTSTPWSVSLSELPVMATDDFKFIDHISSDGSCDGENGQI